ncbi:winged helix-turn-helix transcriptional regulator [Campylobacter upsaliensis]|nr:winged helix-turn-helix transcriptional regulator [Campylobacter upsaliensis]HEF3546517.1 replication/maintenance protein RepL [Campylobacter upsaliensis]
MLATNEIIIPSNQGNKRAFITHKSPKIERITAISQEEIFINKNTGEEVKAQTIVKRLDRKGFEITYLAYLFELFDILGNKKMQVFRYILENKNYDNQLMINTRELAEKAKVSLQTAHETLKILEDKGLIKRRTGGLMVIPKIAHKGDTNREKNLMIKFKEFKEFDEE